MEPPKSTRHRRPGEKRVKEPSSYATSNQKTSTGRPSLTHTFSNMSISGNQTSSNRPLSFLAPGYASNYRERQDSDASRSSQTSALDRFVLRYHAAGCLGLRAQVKRQNETMVFRVVMQVRDAARREWQVIRSVQDVQQLCDSVRGAGVGLGFPMPPPPDQMLQLVEKGSEPIPDPQDKHKSRHQKKKANNGGIFGQQGLTRVMSRLGLTARASQTSGMENILPSVQEWFDEVLVTWQKHWRSRSDETGLSLALENFLCFKSGDDPSVPVSLLSAVDAQIVAAAGSRPQEDRDFDSENSVAKAALRLARSRGVDVNIDDLKLRVFTFAWLRFEERTKKGLTKPKNNDNNNNKITNNNAEEEKQQQDPDLLHFLVLDVKPGPDDPNKVLYTWGKHPQLAHLKLNLIDNISVPPTPQSQEHFFEAWQLFADIVVHKANERLNKLYGSNNNNNDQ